MVKNPKTTIWDVFVDTVLPKYWFTVDHEDFKKRAPTKIVMMILRLEPEFRDAPKIPRNSSSNLALEMSLQ